MPLLGFQKQFAALVESGEKRQTIRAYRKDGRDPKVGQTLYLYTGLRTKQCRKLGEAQCLLANGISIGSNGGMIWYPPNIKGVHMGDVKRRRIARLDGFGSYVEMIEWFDKTHGLPFEGQLIRWGNLSKSPPPRSR